MTTLELAGLTTLLCDADGTLFPSEEPAFDASAVVVGDALAELGVDRRFAGDELRAWAEGRNFRRVLADLCTAEAVVLPDEVLARWVRREAEVVTAALGRQLTPDAEVQTALAALHDRWHPALVSSSALPRLDACLAATGLADSFPVTRRFSAQDSLPAPSSKPDPAIYTWALAALGLTAAEALAVEDAVAGVSSAVDAGIAAIGLLVFVPPAEREGRREALHAAGADVVLDDWGQLTRLLTPGREDAA